jgi:beta-lactamase regulating signal transducer with metallopeptidase domain
MMHAWVLAALSNAVLATGLAIVVAVVTRFVRRPETVALLWLLVLVKLVAPPLLSVPWAHSGSTVVLERLASSSPRELVLGRQTLDSAVLVPIGSGHTHILGAGSLFGRLGRTVQDNAERIFFAWAAGSAVWFGLALFRIVRFVRVLRGAPVATVEIQNEVRQLAYRMDLRRHPEVRLTNCRMAPLVWALVGKPTLLVPVELLQHLTAPQRTTVFAHELAHLKRRDDLVSWFELVALGLFWWHPVAWWARHKRSQAEELCCDAEVITLSPGHARSYAEALLAAIDFISEGPTAHPIAASALSDTGLLRERLERILAANERHRMNRPARFAILTVGLAILPLSLPEVPTAFLKPRHAVVVLRKGVRLNPAAIVPGERPLTTVRDWDDVHSEPGRLVEFVRHEESARPKFADCAPQREPERSAP